MRLVLINLLFWVAAGGAWAWYHVAPPEPPVRYRLTPRPEIPELRFTPDPVGEAAAEILATTNLVNGSFMARNGTRITAFLGTWSAENSKELSVVSHTPDICWVGAGWTPVMGRHPDRVEIELDGVRLPFECRTFRAPGSLHEELTVWCTLVNGRVTGETGRFVAPVEAGSRREERWALQGRRLASSHFFDALKNRSAGRGDKQFVRFSTRLDGDWQRSLKELQSFGQQWLSLSSELRDPAPNPPVPSP
ncbi:MAG: exosortase-associated EpsI family protein [Verrucomicrobia bacterium]|nr:exosortase-associated EpsI family protein [Verrucomicrobiota bacterium]